MMRPTKEPSWGTARVVAFFIAVALVSGLLGAALIGLLALVAS
jgi:hypothetical protein